MCVICALSDRSMMRPFLSHLIIGIGQTVFNLSKDADIYLNSLQITDDNQDITLYFTKNNGEIKPNVSADVGDAVRNLIVEYAKNSKQKANSQVRNIRNDRGREVLVVHLSFPEL